MTLKSHDMLFCGQVLKESFKLYRAINDGIINLVDKVRDLGLSFAGFSELSDVCT